MVNAAAVICMMICGWRIFLSRANRDDVSIENLRQWRIREYTTDDDVSSREFRVYNAIIFEVGRGEKLYALSLGEWFEIAQNHVAEVNQELRFGLRLDVHKGSFRREQIADFDRTATAFYPQPFVRPGSQFRPSLQGHGIPAPSARTMSGQPLLHFRR